METTITVAIIAGAFSIIVAALSFLLTKRAERLDALQQQKREYYKELLLAISDMVVDGIDKEEVNQRFARAAHLVVLVAPPKVITALMAFHNEVNSTNLNSSLESHEKILKVLIKAIRWSLRLPFEKEPFDFHIINTKTTEQDA